MDDKEHEQLNQYIMIKDLGRGAHAKVKLGLNKTDNNLYALKIRNERVRVSEAAVRKEIAILKKLSHPHVLKLHEVIDDSMSNELILVLEYAPVGLFLPDSIEYRCRRKFCTDTREILF